MEDSSISHTHISEVCDAVFVSFENQVFYRVNSFQFNEYDGLIPEKNVLEMLVSLIIQQI